jgi:hypothetical protein
MEIAGLPLHPLVVHAAVVFTPLAVLAAVVFAVVPRWRYLTRWPTAALTLTALGAVWVARVSGRSLLASRPELAPLVRVHQQRGTQLSLLMILFAVVVLVGVWGLGGRSGLVDGRGARETRVAVLDKLLPAVVVVVSLVVVVWCVLTGDAGARAIWG